jgi:hypothetical protein
MSFCPFSPFTLLGANPMRTFTSNLIVLSAQVSDTTIGGTAIDGDTAINFTVAASEVNQRLFIPEAQLVVTGKFRLAKELATISVWISKVIAVVSIPAPAEVEAPIEAIAVDVQPIPAEVIDVETSAEVIDGESAPMEPVKLTAAQKRAATIAAKKASAQTEDMLVAC